MHQNIEDHIEETGDELRARHDDEIIRDVIEEIEALDDDSSDKTGEILRKMVGFEE